mgnify:CR=1 FL=1
MQSAQEVMLCGRRLVSINRMLWAGVLAAMTSSSPDGSEESSDLKGEG